MLNSDGRCCNDKLSKTTAYLITIAAATDQDLLFTLAGFCSFGLWKLCWQLIACKAQLSKKALSTFAALSFLDCETCSRCLRQDIKWISIKLQQFQARFSFLISTMTSTGLDLAEEVSRVLKRMLFILPTIVWQQVCWPHESMKSILQSRYLLLRTIWSWKLKSGNGKILGKHCRN